eukprot:g13377.t1
MSSRRGEEMMLRPNQSAPFKSRSMASSTAVKTSKFKSNFKLSERRQLALAQRGIGLEQAEHRRLPHGRRKTPSLSFASLAGLWRAGLAVQAVAAQSIARSDQPQLPPQSIARHDQGAAAAAAAAKVEVGRQGHQQQQQPACSGESGESVGSGRGATCSCSCGRQKEPPVEVGAGWSDKAAGWSDEQVADADRSCQGEKGARTYGCGQQPAARSDGGGGGCGSGGGAEVRNGNGCGSCTDGSFAGSGSHVDGSCGDGGSGTASTSPPPPPAALADRPVEEEEDEEEEDEEEDEEEEDEEEDEEERRCGREKNGGRLRGGEGARNEDVSGGSVRGPGLRLGREGGTREDSTRLDKYDFSLSTEENYASLSWEEGHFTDRFREARSLLDYSYHSHYTLERQQVQDDILQGALRTLAPGSVERPWAVFTAGAMGAGKSHVMGLLGERGVFPMEAFVQVDPDRLRTELPEMEGYIKRDSATAGSLTHKEAGLMAEILEETALLQGRNILVDGSMRDGAWYTLHVEDLRMRFPRLRVAIIHVWAPEEEVLSRAVRRGLQTGRVIPPTVLRETIQAVPRSVQALAPLADYCVRIDNINIGDTVDVGVDADSASVGFDADGEAGVEGCDSDDRRQDLEKHSPQEQQQQDGGCVVTPSSSGAVAPAAEEGGEGGGGRDACGRIRIRIQSSEMEVPLPVLATPGETWESFRATFSQDPS